MAIRLEETSLKGINAIRKRVYDSYGKTNQIKQIGKERRDKTNKLIVAQIEQNRAKNV